MRKKMNSKKNHEKTQKRNQLIVGIILVALMALSTLGYAFNGQPDDEIKKSGVTYNGVNFIDQGEFFIGAKNNIQIALVNEPGNYSEEINISKISFDYIGMPLYISSVDYQAERTIYINLDVSGLNQLAQRTQKACYVDEIECDESFPIKTCSDNLIIIRESNQSRIYEDENCVFIEGPKEDLTKLTDLFLIEIFGI